MSVPSIGSSSFAILSQVLAAHDKARASASSSTAARATTNGKLSESDQRVVAKLQQQDRAVRAHELAHIAAGAGVVTSGASYTYETGPDGKRYANGGEVSIDVSPGRTPQDTLRKAEQIRASALAPADPSAQDRSVAARAEQMATEARIELTDASAQKTHSTVSSGSNDDPASALYRSVAGGHASSGSRVNTWA
ncbi:MAG: hypothetical protein EKK49_01085 [Rhodocyclaceae bacterium]|nr:MAG: hypothetical protein EKK49_01085 [Rhodocyclaceae bacterium]